MATATLDSATAEAAEAESAETTASADDLLSKMAGAEIDRLLNEADAERAPKPADPAKTESIAEAEGNAATSSATSSVADAADTDSALAAQMDELLKAMDAKPAPADGAPPPAAVADTPAATAESERLNVLAAELEVDKPSPPAAVAAPAIGSPSVVSEAPATEGAARPQSIPLLIRPLVWINKPFAALSDGSRGLLGKVAVVTVANAAAVLVYVMVFRKVH